MEIEIEIDVETPKPMSRWISDVDFLTKLGACQSLPEPPGVASALIELSQDPTADLAKLADAVSVDDALAQKIICICNTPTYSRARRIDNLRQALGLLGLKQTLNLALSVSMLDSVRQEHSIAVDIQMFWRRSLSTAVIAKLLAISGGVRDSESYFLCALLCDIGMLVFDQVEPTLYATSDESLVNHQRAVWLERTRYPLDHGVVGAWLLESWGMPEMYQFVAAYSHADTVDHPAWASAVKTMQTASAIADLFCREPESIDANKLLDETLNKEALLNLVEHIACDVRDTCRLFDLRLWTTGELEAIVASLPAQFENSRNSNHRVVGDLAEPLEVSPKHDPGN